MGFHYAGLLVDAWLSVQDRLRTAWRVLPGDLLALLVMRACGVPATSGRQVEAADGTQAILVADPRTALYLDHQRIAISAQTLGRYVLSREPLQRELVEHELEHVRQWERLGPAFLPLYLVSSGIAVLVGGDPYWANAFEERARQRAAEAIADGAAADFRVNA